MPIAAIEQYMLGAVEVRASSGESDGGQLDITSSLGTQKDQLDPDTTL